MQCKYSLLVVLFIIGCGTSQEVKKDEGHKEAITADIPVSYRLYFRASRTLQSPPDEVSIDTTGQMVFVTQQRMSDGTWRSPKGLAFLEPKHADSLIALITDSLLYTIRQEDVISPCPDGADYDIRIERMDKKWTLATRTNTCARTANLLTGERRQLIKRLIDLFEEIRGFYRPRLVK